MVDYIIVLHTYLTADTITEVVCSMDYIYIPVLSSPHRLDPLIMDRSAYT